MGAKLYLDTNAYKCLALSNVFELQWVKYIISIVYWNNKINKNDYKNQQRWGSNIELKNKKF